MEIVNLALLVAIILIVWFQSNAFVEYVKLFRLDWVFWIPLYEQQKEDDLLLTYTQFIKKNWDNFFTRLITCPLCFSMWVCLFISLIANVVFWWPSMVIIALVVYYVYKRIVS